jgi:plasmid stabilization system protein ParE
VKSRRKVYRSDSTESDLFEIWLHIASDNPAAADRFIDKIHKKLQKLAVSPRIGLSREQLAAGLRSFPVGDYLIFYREVSDGIVVVRVLSGYRDIDALFDLV